jgi:hypothetical protein
MPPLGNGFPGIKALFQCIGVTLGRTSFAAMHATSAVCHCRLSAWLPGQNNGISNSRKFKSTIIIRHCSFNRRYAKPKSIRHLLNTWIYLFLKVIRWGTRCQKRAPVDSAGDK